MDEDPSNVARFHYIRRRRNSEQHLLAPRPYADRDRDTLHFTIVGMAGFPFSGYSLTELVDGTKWLMYDGTAVATIRDNTITGTFDGRISLLDQATRAILGECRAADHRIDFVR